MSELGAVEGRPVTHPARRVLEAAELVTTGVLDSLPEDLPVELPADGGAVVLEDAEGTPVAALPPGGRAGPPRPFAHGPLGGPRRTPAGVREELAGLAAAPVPAGEAA